MKYIIHHEVHHKYKYHTAVKTNICLRSHYGINFTRKMT